MTCIPANLLQTNDQGRAFFSIEIGENIVTLFIRNIYNLERDSSQSPIVRTVIESIWDILQIPGCYVTADLLREAFKFETDETFANYFYSDDMTVGRITKMMHAFVKDIPHINHCDVKDKAEVVLQKFINSKLGILLLRHMVDLPSSTTRDMANTLLSEESLINIERVFVKSPYCCFYVNNIQTDVLETKDKKYIRTRPIYTFEKKRILNKDIELKDHGKKQLTGACYLLGTLMSGYMGHTGNYYADQDEYEFRRDAILSAWKSKENFVSRTTATYSSPKWYDTYAGSNNLSESKYQAVMSDAPINSIYSTLSAIKRNLIVLLYICRLFLAQKKCMSNADIDDLLEEMAEYVSQYFSHGATKSPLKLSNASKSYYMRCDEPVFRNGVDMDVNIWTTYIERMGLDDRKHADLMRTSKDSGMSCYQNIRMVNCLSGRELNEADRLSMCKNEKKRTDRDESDSIILIPAMLYSYLNTKDTTDRQHKIVCGMATQISPQQNTITPFYVCKASFLYGNKVKQMSMVDDLHQDTCEIIRQIDILCNNGHTRDEAYQLLSLTTAECEKIDEILAADDFEPVSKKQKYDSD